MYFNVSFFIKALKGWILSERSALKAEIPAIVRLFNFLEQIDSVILWIAFKEIKSRLAIIDSSSRFSVINRTSLI